MAAAAAVLGLWWIVHITGFFDRTVLPSPAVVGRALSEGLSDGSLPIAAGKSLLRLGFGFAVAILIGTLVGLLMVRSPLVYRSVGSLVLGLRSLPAIVWLPLAILWFGISERAIVFVVILGAFPSVALGTANSLRQVPPLLERAGRTLGARGWDLYGHVVLPAALPGYVGGLQQAWAFAWWSLMAGELISTGGRGLGHALEQARQRFDTSEVLAVMVLIVLIGMVVDLVVFGVLDRRIRAKRGLLASR
jgi:NitT/TauT family transport system permease protein